MRLSDILDFDRERTPRILFESLGIGDSGPGAAVSLLEWNKHLAVHTIVLAENEIVVSADSSHPAIERSVRDFCALIEREVRDTLSVLRRNPTEIGETYRIDLALNVRAQVRSIGYVYRDFAFRLNESSISKILMGEGLYSNKAAALRELVQNSIDACRVKALLGRNPAYQPSITVKHSRILVGVSGSRYQITVSAWTNLYFQIISSVLETVTTHRRTLDGMLRDKAFIPISRFGIGVLSIFMIGDILEVATRNVDSPRGDTTHRTARIEGRFGLAFVTEDSAGPEGTRVRVRLSFDNRYAALLFLSQAATYLRDTVRRPAVPVTVNLPNTSFTLEPSLYLRLNEEKPPIFKQGELSLLFLTSHGGASG